MATLIEIRVGKRVIGRCDANCYGASGNKCDCVCGGRNHGVGLCKAIEQTQQELEKMIDEYRASSGDQKSVIVAFPNPVQVTLFDILQEMSNAATKNQTE